MFDVFRVHDSNGSPIEFSNYYFLQKNIKEELRKVFLENEPVSSIYKGRCLIGKGKTDKYKNNKPKVKIIGRSVSIESYDAMGTFMMETKVFADLNMQVKRAVLHTEQEKASNIFYLRPEDVRHIMYGEKSFRSKLQETLSLLKNPKSILWGEPVENI